MELPAPYGTVKLDENRQAIWTVYDQQLYMKDDTLAVKTVANIPTSTRRSAARFSELDPGSGTQLPRL